MQVKRALNRIAFCIYRYLSGNQLTCDCKLYGVFNASQRLPTFTGTCFKPDELRGKNIKSLKLLEFCRKYFESGTQTIGGKRMKEFPFVSFLLHVKTSDLEGTNYSGLLF